MSRRGLRSSIARGCLWCEVAFGQLLLERHVGALDSRFVFSDPAMRRTLESGFLVDP